MPTVVFADVVGSTGLFEQMGDANASRLMTRLTGMLGKVFGQHQGRVVKLLGDGVFAAFPEPSSATTACVTLQSRFQTEPIIPGGASAPIQMQMGVESGELVEIDGDCFGDAVNSAARLAGLAGADQILHTGFPFFNRILNRRTPALDAQIEQVSRTRQTQGVKDGWKHLQQSPKPRRGQAHHGQQ